jgi:hypothetical protein
MIGYTVLPDVSERFFRGDTCRNADWNCQQKRGYPFDAPSMGDDTADLKKIRNYDKTLTFYGFHLHFPATGVSPVCLQPANLSVMAPSPV